MEEVRTVRRLSSRAHSCRVIRVYETFLSERGGEIERFARVLTLDGWAIGAHLPAADRLGIVYCANGMGRSADTQLRR